MSTNNVSRETGSGYGLGSGSGSGYGVQSVVSSAVTNIRWIFVETVVDTVTGSESGGSTTSSVPDSGYGQSSGYGSSPVSSADASTTSKTTQSFNCTLVSSKKKVYFGASILVNNFKSRMLAKLWFGALSVIWNAF